jgi:hypothetical protein
MKTILLASTAFAVPVAAFAQAAPTSANELTADMWNTLIGVATVAIPIIGKFVIDVLRAQAAKQGLEVSAGQASAFETAAMTCLSVGLSKAKDIIANEGWTSKAAHDFALQEATDYMNQHFPDAASAVTSAASAANKNTAVTTALAARLPAAATIAAASPATPPVMVQAS